MESILDSKLASELRESGYSNEEILDEIVEFAEIYENEALLRQVRAREDKEMEIIRKEVKQWS